MYGGARETGFVDVAFTSDKSARNAPGVACDSVLLRQSHAAWDWWRRFARSRCGAGLVFAWSLAEAIAWPIIPEFILVPIAAGARQRFYLPLVCAVLGSALGGTLLFEFACTDPDRALRLLPRLPAVTDRQISRAAALIDEHGLQALALQPWTFIPLKVWTILAATRGLAPARAIPTFIVSRGLRMVIFAVLASRTGGWFGGFLRQSSLFVAAAYVVVFFWAWRRIMR